MFMFLLESFIMFFIQLACTGGSCVTQSEEISPVFSLWATLVGLCIAHYVVERSAGYLHLFSFFYITHKIVALLTCGQSHQVIGLSYIFVLTSDLG